MFRRSLAVLALGAVFACSSAKDAGQANASAPPPPDSAAQAAAAAAAAAQTPPPPPAVTPVAATNPPAKPPKMVKVAIENGSVATIEPLKWQDYQFKAGSDQCTVSGRIEALAGGNKDFDAFILDDDNFKVWTSNLEPKGTSSGRAQKWSFNQKITAPGTWHLLISNRFSELSKKVVKVWFSRTCPEGSTT